MDTLLRFLALFSFDPLAFIGTLAALWLAWAAFQRSHQVKVKVLKCSSPYGDRIGFRGRELILRLRNDGIPLHTASVHLRFRTIDDRGTKMIQLSPDETIGDSIFETGMIGEFRLQRRDLDYTTYRWVEDLNDVAEQHAEFVVMTQGKYEAIAIRIGLWRCFQLLIRGWNSIVWKVKLRQVRKGGSVRNTFPAIEAMHFQVQSFVDGVRKDVQREIANAEKGSAV